ncbi:MAG: hypothetical protein CMQ29_03030 [Gammaproteobacteria bacterium]|nr:hypothetical protein [Gammaproteobacteria bacterium]
MSETSDTKDKRPSIAQLALPSILGNLLFAIVAMVQTKFVGELGAESLAAVNVGQRMFFALQAVMMAVSAGTTALVARAWGAEDYEEASRVTMASLFLACTFGLILTIPGILFAAPVASIFGLSDRSVELAADYIIWMSIFNVAFGINFIIGAALRAAGDAWTPLWIGVGMNIVNVAALYVLVPGEFGAPAMGAPGAAIAAGISFALGGVVMVVMWLRQLFVVRYISNKWYRRERFMRLLDVGYPAAAEMMVFQAGFVVFFMLVGRYYGTEAFAAYGVGGMILSLCMVVGFGFSIAGSTLVGQHLGAEDFDGAVKAGWSSMGYAAVAMGSIGWTMAYFAEELARYFVGDDPLTVELTTAMVTIMGISTPLLAAEFAIGGALRGAGDTRFPLMATIIGLLGVRVTLAAIFTFAGMPVIWVYATMVGDYFVKASMLLWRFHSGRWKRVLTNEALAV